MPPIKRETPPNYLISLQLSLWLGISTLAALADPVYRCGDAYSASEQCDNAVAHELLNPSSPRTLSSFSSSPSTLTDDKREAQSLEKKRLHAIRQASPHPSAREPTAAVNHLTPSPREASIELPLLRSPAHRKFSSPYFMAKVPTAQKEKAPPTKKSTDASVDK